MFWLRNKKNNFQLRTLIWRPAVFTFSMSFISCTLTFLCFSISSTLLSKLTFYRLCICSVSLISCVFYYLYVYHVHHVLSLSSSSRTQTYSCVSSPFHRGLLLLGYLQGYQRARTWDVELLLGMVLALPKKDFKNTS